MIEKRSFPRLPRDWEIEGQASESTLAQPILIKGEIRDLSGAGFSFRSGLACSPKALVHFTIKPTDRLRPMVGVARVAWTRKQDGFYDSGAQFVWVRWQDSEVQSTIAQYVVDEMRERPQ
jgi:hypothetical protein